MPDMPAVLTTAQVARLARVSQMTVVRWVKQGRLEPINKPNPLLKRNQPYLFRRADIERLLEPLLAAS